MRRLLRDIAERSKTRTPSEHGVAAGLQPPTVDVDLRPARGLIPRAIGVDEIAEFIRGYTSGEVPDYQAAAWAMGEMMAGDATEGQVGGFLLALAATVFMLVVLIMISTTTWKGTLLRQLMSLPL